MSRFSRCRRSRKQSGFALFLALLVLLVLTISGIALMFNTSVEQSLSSTETKISKTFYAADSGIEFAIERIRTAPAAYIGGDLPKAMSAGYSTASPDIKVTVAQPIVVGFTIHPGDAVSPSGSSYSPQQVVEKFYHLSSTSSSPSIQSTKTIVADVGIYPLQLGIDPTLIRP